MSTKTHHLCDRCKAVYQDRSQLSVFKRIDNTFQRTSGFDLCAACLTDLLSFMEAPRRAHQNRVRKEAKEVADKKAAKKATRKVARKKT